MEQFKNLSSKFLVITKLIGTLDYNEEYHREKLNALLNDLNSLDYKTLQLADCSKTINLIKAFTIIPVEDDTLIVKACCLIVSIINKQTVQVPQDVLKSALKWLLEYVSQNLNVGLCDVLKTMQVLTRGNVHPITEITTNLLSSQGLLMMLLKNPTCMKSKSLKYESCSPTEIQLSTMLCLETLLCTPMNLSESVSNEILETILDQIYKTNSQKFDKISYCLFIASALNSCKHICFAHKTLYFNHVGKLLGAAKAFMLFGLPDIPEVLIHKVNMSQQAISEPQFSPISKGGKVAKTRKPRTTNKSKKSDSKNRALEEIPFVNDSKSAHFNQNLSTDLTLNVTSFFTTSYSDFSESDTGRAQKDRQKLTKLRFAAIHLIGVLGQNIETKSLFGYWHSLFPSEPITGSSIALLNCILKDPNPRCRMAALQVASVIWLGSKSFLIQAESSNNPPMSYMPFSIALGNMIVSMYFTLTQALSSESSLLVLTQILKCLTVLIQATPFKRLESGFVSKFVTLIKKLVYHKDCTIQVAALRVMEYLIANNELTEEIYECVGIAKLNIKLVTNPNHLNDSGANELIENEFDEEDCDSDEENVIHEITNNRIEISKPSVIQMSWLLQVSLRNLGVNIHDSENVPQPTIALYIRIESLQVLTTMARHFLWLKNHLNHISNVLCITLNDPLPEIRLYAAKFLDVMGHAMNTYLLSEAPDNQEEINLCLQFWLSMIPVVVKQLQDSSQTASLKAICCDSLSNIGVHVYERLPRDKQIVLISLLSGSGCDEEHTIRAAAIRALAVYVLFPSLKEDMCYVENTAESIIRALEHGNIEVRIKGSWALGNISDTLLANSYDVNIATISDDLLKRIFELTLSCKNNDKIRSNSVRTLGNLLRLIKMEHIQQPLWQELCLKAITDLYLSCTVGGNMKVKWNSCYAIGNFMKSSVMFYDNRRFNWQETIFPALCSIIIKCPNFKVRINAASALAVPDNRKYIDRFFYNIWASLLEALEQSDQITDFNEYQHRDNLMEQLCITISHYISLTSNEDLISIQSILIRFDSIKQHWKRVINRMLPEKAASLLSASLKLKNMEKTIVKFDQKQAIQLLNSCFVSLTEYV